MIEEKKGEVIIKGSKAMYVWMVAATAGFLIACSFLIVHGLKFNSMYSLFYLGGGIVFTPFYLYITLWHLPGFMPGKVLLKIVPGEKGTVIGNKGAVPIKNIRNVDLIRNQINLINDIVIETYKGEKVKVRTYNLLSDTDYLIIVDQYIYPYMDEGAKEKWDQKIDFEHLHRVTGYERKEQTIGE